jgi:O-antigen/teichoic acid export membrane protein
MTASASTARRTADAAKMLPQLAKSGPDRVAGAVNERPRQGFGFCHHPEIVQQFTLVTMRGSITVAKFALTFYITRVLGLADLGIYGLIAGGTTLVPALFGFGVTDWISRVIVNIPSREAIPYMTSRIALSVAVQAVGQPLACLLNYALGAPIPWGIMALAGPILFLEHIVSDAQDMLIFRGHVYFASIVLFMRAGLWPPLVMLWAWLVPSARTLDHLLLGWIAGLALVSLVLTSQLLANQRWRLLGLRIRWLFDCIRNSLPFYLKDISNVGSLYLDRFVVSFLLGLELTGVYTFFWSFANVVNSLVIHGTVQPRIPHLLVAARDPDRTVLRRLERRVQIETGTWAILLTLGAITAMPFILPYLGRPLLQENLFVFWIMIAAALVRIGADCYSYVLLALHRDRAIAVISIIGVLGSATLNATLTPLVGILGAGLAYLVTASGLLIARFTVSRSLAPADKNF